MTKESKLFFGFSMVFLLVSSIIYLASGIKPGEEVQEKLKVEKDEAYLEEASKILKTAFVARLNGGDDSLIDLDDVGKQIDKKIGSTVKTVVYQEGKPKSIFWIIFAVLSGICLKTSVLCQYFGSEMRKRKLRYWELKSELETKKNKEALKAFQKFNSFQENLPF